MKKTLKRTLAIVMAVAMLFALSVTAFAYDNEGYVEITIKNNNTLLYHTYLEASDITGYLANGIYHLYDLPTDSDKTVYFPYTITPADALIAAYKESSGANFDANSFAYTWYDILDPNNNYAPITVNGKTLQGLYFTKFWNLASDNGNYYQTGYENGIYTYVWRGNSWSFAINEQDYADLYASDYALNGTSPVITSIELTYMTIESDPFQRTEPIPGAIIETGN